MNIACGNCPAKYAVPDDKVRGRKVRITCKRCGAGIVVDGTKLLQTAPDPSPMPARQRHSTKVGGLEAPAESSRAIPAAAPAPAPEDEPWTVAVTDDDQREMTLAEIVRAYEAGTIDAETFIWRDGMDDWLTPYEIPVIEAALRQHGLAPRTSTPPEPPAPEPPRPKEQSGAWREPGRWDASGAAANVSFDDVTVAMAAPKAQALLEAVTATGAASEELAPALRDGEESTVVSDSRRFGIDTSEDLPKDRRSPRPAAGAPAEAESAPKPKGITFARPDADPDGTTRPVGVAARAAGRRSEQSDIDLFARKAASEDEAPRARMPSAPDAPRARMPSAPDGPRARMPSTPPDAGQAGMTGARNETSVLFTLDQLTKPQAKPAPRTEKIDAEALLAPSPSIKLEEEDGPPSVAKIGGGGLFPTAAMAAPDFNAPAVPSAPSNPPPAAAAQATPAQERAGGGSMLWVVLGALGVAGAGAASYFFMVRAPEPPPMEAAATATTPVPVATAEPSPSANGDTTAAAGSAAVAATSVPSGAAAPSTAPVASQPAAPTAPGTAAPTATAATAAPAATPGATALPKPTAAAQPKPTAAAATETPAAPAPAEGPAFDKDAAAQALGAAATQAQSECASQEGPHGSGKVTVTFVNSGRATNALVSGDFAGSALGGCVARVFRSAKVPPFGGDSVRVTKGVHIP